MKKLCVGSVLAFALLLLALPASAQTPCGAVCQAYYPCDYACDLCVGDPGLWEDGGGCWGEIVSGTCGDIGQCGYVPCTPEWQYDEISYQGVKPQFDYVPCEWQFGWNPATQRYEWFETCDWFNPYKCTVYGVHRFVRHQENCDPDSSETFCLLNNNGSQRYIGRYGFPSAWECCNDSYEWNCTDWFPQCPNF